MQYKSTRGNSPLVTGSQAIINGISPDGGLYIPTEIPVLIHNIEEYATMSYQEIAFEILHQYFPDLDKEKLHKEVYDAYGNSFDTEEVVEIKNLVNISVMELFHGPTLAFKDMALSILPSLMKLSLEKQNVKEKIIILTATSGDTGKAALEGFKNKEGISIIVFYPENGVSPMQKHQMVTSDGTNAMVAAVKGNFDDAQSGVKEIFGDVDFKKALKEKGYLLSSANSINIGRLIPQIVYYVYGYSRLLKNKQILSGDLIDVSVPTGNFGNILAAYYAGKMGVPINKLVCASNKNNVLYDFFTDSIYDKNRKLHKTSSPSMDILLSSNLERLLSEITDGNSKQVSAWMSDLNNNGMYTINDNYKSKLESFSGIYATEEQVKVTIKEVFEKFGYLIDPHTAIGVFAANNYKKDEDIKVCLVAGTASPYKFSEDVCSSLEIENDKNSFFELSKKLSEVSKTDIPNRLLELENATIRFSKVCKKDELRNIVMDFVEGI